MSNRPEDFPSTPITKEAHSGLPGVPEDVAERVDNPNFEFDTPLIHEAKNLSTPEDLGYTANVRGVDHPVVTPEEQEALAAQVAASRAPEKKKWSLGTKLTILGVGALAAVGIGISANAAAEGPFMKAPTATAPPVPGQGEKTPSANQSEAPLPGATAPNTNETVTYVPVTEADVKDYAAIAANARVNFGEYREGAKTLPVFVEKFNEMLNTHLSAEELANSTHLVSKSGATGPQALLEMKLTAYDDLFQGDGGQFKATMIKESKENFEKWLATKDEEHPFEVAFVSTGSNSGIEYAYTSNSTENSAADWPNPPKVYKFVAADPVLGPVKAGEQKSSQPWQISKDTKMVPSK